ncbi:hypothetical protein Peur_061047 [Populus x canadensis]
MNDSINQFQQTKHESDIEQWPQIQLSNKCGSSKSTTKQQKIQKVFSFIEDLTKWRKPR